MSYQSQTSNSADYNMVLSEARDPEVSDRDTNPAAHPDSSPQQTQPAGFDLTSDYIAPGETTDANQFQVRRDAILARIATRG